MYLFEYFLLKRCTRAEEIFLKKIKFSFISIKNISVELKMLKFQVVLGFIFVILILTVWWKRRRTWHLAGLIPGCNGLPIVGILYKAIGATPEGLLWFKVDEPKGG